jgi:hypothetical protein
MERHLGKNAIAEPVANLFASLSESIAPSNESWLLPTARMSFVTRCRKSESWTRCSGRSKHPRLQPRV